MGIKGVLRIVVVAASFLAVPTLKSQEPPRSGAEGEELAALKAEVERLRSIMPAQAVAMTQVAYNMNNLWFAVHAENWPLAQFYFSETRVRLRWAIRITPTRKVASGEIELSPMLERLEGAQLAALGEAVAAHDVPRFETAYGAMLDGCYGCHTASDKPYLRLQIPAAPAEGMLKF
jgi:hypothetical protein